MNFVVPSLGNILKGSRRYWFLESDPTNLFLKKNTKTSDLQVLVQLLSLQKRTLEKGTELLTVEEEHRSVTERETHIYTGLKKKFPVVNITWSWMV